MDVCLSGTDTIHTHTTPTTMTTHTQKKAYQVALSRHEKMCVLHVRKKLSHLQLGSQSDEYG